MEAPNQPRLVASVRKSSGREEFRITLKDYNDGETKAEIAVFQRRHDHDWERTPRCVIVSGSYLPDLIRGLLEASALLKSEAA